MGVNKTTGNFRMPGVNEMAKLRRVAHQNDYVAITGATEALVTSGINVIAGGTGLAGLTLAAPKWGDRCRIVVGSLTSGDVVVTTPAGVTFDGTNNTATLNAAAEALDLVCHTEGSRWVILVNTGSVALSDV